jgi:PRC-barrel domain
MLKTLFATTALASMMAWGVSAQTDPAADEAENPPVMENQVDGTAPEMPDAAETAPIEPDTADTEMAPADSEMTPESDTADTEMAPADSEMSPESDTADTEMAPADSEMLPESDAADTEMAPADTMAPESDTADTEMAPADSEMAQDPATMPPLEEGWSQVDMATVSADTLIGTDIRTYDQDDIAAVEDVLMTPDGQVESVVARFGGFLGFGENTVLLSMDEINVVQDADGNMAVLTDLTPEALKDRPEYEAEEEAS